MPDIEFNNKILILLRQAKGKSAGNTLDQTESHQRLSLLEGSVSAPRNTYRLWERISVPGRQGSGQSRTSGKGGGKLIGLPTNTKFSCGGIVIGTN